MFAAKGVTVCSGMASRNGVSSAVRGYLSAPMRCRMKMAHQEVKEPTTRFLSSAGSNTENGTEGHLEMAKMEKIGDKLESTQSGMKISSIPIPPRRGRSGVQYQKPRTTRIIDLSVRPDARKKARSVMSKNNSLSESSSSRKASESLKGNISNDHREKRHSASSGKQPKLKSTEPFRKVYVHPLSQIILQHLQNNRHDWVRKVGLDKGGLVLNRDGTFVLRFTSSEGVLEESTTTNNLDDNKAENEAESTGKSLQGGKLWTSYDPVEKKHWLAVQKGALVGQYMLQDNLKPAWHSSKHSTPEKIQLAVDEMIESINKANT